MVASKTVRHTRVGQLHKLALLGKSYSELLNTALSWGVSEITAKSYIKNVQAMLNRQIKAQAQIQTSDDEDEVIGSGSDIIKSSKNVGKDSGRSWFKM